MTTLTATFGGNLDVTMNPVCIALGNITDGGWYLCPTSITGTIFGFYTTSEYLHCLEVLVYTQEAIQLHGLSTAFVGINNPAYPTNNVLQKFVILNALANTPPRVPFKCVQITPSGGLLA